MPATTKKTDKTEEKEIRLTTPISSRGVYIFPNGDKYNGDYVQLPEGALLRRGKGEHTTADGMKYAGEWKDDKMHGKGKITYSSGAVYEGEFDNNCCHGHGIYTWPNGSYFEGIFKANKIEGDGSFTDVHKQVWFGNFTHKSGLGLKFKLNM